MLACLLSPLDTPAFTSFLTRATLRPACTIHILELGYTHESLYSPTLLAESHQHDQLVALLRLAGGLRLCTRFCLVLLVLSSSPSARPSLRSVCPLSPLLAALHVQSVRQKATWMVKREAPVRSLEFLFWIA